MIKYIFYGILDPMALAANPAISDRIIYMINIFWTMLLFLI